MKTQTDNSNIVVENLEKAVEKYINTMEGSTNEEIQYAAHDFKEGWKAKEKQLQPLIDSHKDLLKYLTYATSKYVPESFFGQGETIMNPIYFDMTTAIEKANNIINSLKV